MEAWLDFWGSLGGSGFLGVKVAGVFTRKQNDGFLDDESKLFVCRGWGVIYFFKKSCALEVL